MYERSAIVLERYFERLLGFNEENNLKQNFKNYCDLFTKFNIFQEANSAEFSALSEFQAAETTIEEIQSSQEKLYKKNAKLEYNRDLIFTNITQKPEEIEKCIVKLEDDISKNQAKLISLREKFIEAIKDYNDKKAKLAKCKKNRKNAESDYNSIFEITKQNLESIDQQYIEIAKSFSTEENELELISIMVDNGKEEKIPFNNSVITAATKLGFEIFKIEVECYLQGYEMSQKLINELNEGAVSVELHQKTIRNINVKLEFINAQKEYLIQFLDYERITVIYGKRTHRTLMVEACEKFEADIMQINNLFALLQKEIAGKSTKKAYKELYNKSYLLDIEEKDAKFKKEKNKINLPVGTVMNSNYWRIEGIKNIYTVFYKQVSEVFGKDLVEFDVPKEPEIDEINANENTEIIKKSANVELPKNEEKHQPEENIPNLIEEDLNADPNIIVQELEDIEEITEKKVEMLDNVEENIKVEVEDSVEEIIVEEVITEKVEEQVNITVENVQNTSDTMEIVTETIDEKDVVIEEIGISKKYSTPKTKKKYTRKIVAYQEIPQELENTKKCKNEKKSEKGNKKQTKNNNKKEKKNESIELKESSLFEEINNEAEEAYDKFEDKYKDIEKQIAELEELDDLSIDVKDMLEDTPYEDDDMFFEEESIFGDIENKEYEDLRLKKDKKTKGNKKGIFGKIMKINSKQKKEVNN